jgi:hypothetical protein
MQRRFSPHREKRNYRSPVSPRFFVRKKTRQALPISARDMTRAERRRYEKGYEFDFKLGEETIRNGTWEPAELGRMECRKTFAFSREWNERVYATKEVRPIFVEEADEIVVVRIYAYYL